MIHGGSPSFIVVFFGIDHASETQTGNRVMDEAVVVWAHAELMMCHCYLISDPTVVAPAAFLHAAAAAAAQNQSPAEASSQMSVLKAVGCSQSRVRAIRYDRP